MDFELKEDESSNQWLGLISVGFLFTTLGFVYIGMESIGNIPSLGFFGGAVLFFASGYLKYKNDKQK